MVLTVLLIALSFTASSAASAPDSYDASGNYGPVEDDLEKEVADADDHDDEWAGKKMGGDAWGLSDTDEKDKGRHCRHGVWDANKSDCVCFKGWSTAHITDTLDFFEGVCEQYQCVDDTTCANVMKIPGAICPVKNWNCYCGWEAAFKMDWHGYETQQKEGGGECMGVMYTFSIWASTSLEEYFKKAWLYFLVAAGFLIFFGRKRFNCDHHRPSLPKALRTCLGCPPRCTGECIDSPGWLEMGRDDLAWSLYVIELGVWTYVFALVMYVIALFIWSIVLWALVIVTCICVLIAGLCAACGEGAGACDCNCCDGGCACGDCCFAPIGMHGGGMGGGGASDAFYFSGTWPYDPFWGSSGYGGHSSPDDCNCCGGCCLTLCRPIAWMIWVFPAMPENVWGGLVGYLMGTRTGTETQHLYQGGSAFIDAMGMRFRRSADLHADGEWRTQVHDFLLSAAAPYVGPESPQGSRFPSTMAASAQRGVGYLPTDNMQVETIRGKQVTTIGNARVIHVDRSFTMAEDNCVPSSFEDYEKNECWICQGTSDESEWDVWMSCRHMFCKNCSSEMLRRRMPCALCRVGSTTVLRGKKCAAASAPGQATMG